jgi:hypothetical protein
MGEIEPGSFEFPAIDATNQAWGKSTLIMMMMVMMLP